MRVYPIIKCTEEGVAAHYAAQINASYQFNGEKDTPWTVVGTLKQSEKFWDYLGENPYLHKEPGISKKPSDLRGKLSRVLEDEEIDQLRAELWWKTT